jgi:hypothetical protein
MRATPCLTKVVADRSPNPNLLLNPRSYPLFSLTNINKVADAIRNPPRTVGDRAPVDLARHERDGES